MVQLEAIMWSKSLPYGPIVLNAPYFWIIPTLGQNYHRGPISMHGMESLYLSSICIELCCCSSSIVGIGTRLDLVGYMSLWKSINLCKNKSMENLNL